MVSRALEQPPRKRISVTRHPPQPPDGKNSSLTVVVTFGCLLRLLLRMTWSKARCLSDPLTHPNRRQPLTKHIVRTHGHSSNQEYAVMAECLVVSGWGPVFPRAPQCRSWPYKRHSKLARSRRGRVRRGPTQPPQRRPRPHTCHSELALSLEGRSEESESHTAGRTGT